MKKLIFGLLAVMMFSFNGECGNYLPKSSSALSELANFSKLPIGISIKLTFGRGENCEGRRICSIVIGADLAAGPNNFGVSGTNGRMTLAISDYNLAEIFNHFHEASIIFDENETIPSDIVRALGLKSNIIMAGTYKIVYNERTRQNEVNF